MTENANTPAPDVDSLTPDQAGVEIENTLGNASHPYHRGDERALARVTALYNRKYGADTPASDRVGAARQAHEDQQAQERDGEAPTEREVTAGELVESLPPAPEGHEWEPKVIEEMVVAAKDTLGMESQEISRWVGELTHLVSSGKAPTVEEGNAVLRKTWGDAYDINLSLAMDTFALLPPTMQQALEDTDLGNLPALVIRLYELGKEREGVQAQIDGIYANPNHPYNLPMHPGHERAILRMQQLMRKVHGAR